MNEPNQAARTTGQYLKFAAVGISGTSVNLVVFYLSFALLDMNLNFASIVAFIVACSSNFIFNALWTFKSQDLLAGSQLRLHKYVKYFFINTAGLMINLLILNTMVYFFGGAFAIPGQLIGILGGSIFNFLLSRKLVFFYD